MKRPTLADRMDELYPETIGTRVFGKVDKCHRELTDTCAFLSAEADTDTELTNLSQRQVDELLGYLIEEISVHVESYETALNAMNQGFPDQVVE